MSRRFLNKRFFWWLVWLLLSIPATAIARLDILPQRVIFEPGMRSAEVFLQNRSQEAYSYRISWDDLVYVPDMGRQRVSEEHPRITPAAADFIRYAPRHVLLAPGESQTVRLMLRLPANTPHGEYRSHLLLQRQGQATLMQFEDTEAGLSMNLQVALGISIPVIIRHGPGEAQVRLIDARFQSAAQSQTSYGAVVLDIEREGRYSTYLSADIWGGRAQQQLLGRAVERALHTDAQTYQIMIPLHTAPDNDQLLLEISYPRRDGRIERFSHRLLLR